MWKTECWEARREHGPAIPFLGLYILVVNVECRKIVVTSTWVVVMVEMGRSNKF